MITLKKILTNLAFSTLCVAFTSSATPIVTDWGYIVDSAFTYSELESGSAAAGSNNNAYWTAEEGSDTPTTLTWGVDAGNGLSSISVDDGSLGNNFGSLMTNGAAVHTATLEHDNNAISNTSDSLIEAILSTNLILNPTDPAGTYGVVLPFSPPALNFDIFFTETDNSGTCVVLGGPKCSDIFVIDLMGGAGGAVFDSVTNTFNQVFPLFEHHYNAQITVSGLAMLSDPICLAAGAPIGCIGITTQENMLNSFEVTLKISLVPEPSVILLMALALIGIFASTRNKHI